MAFPTGPGVELLPCPPPLGSPPAQGAYTQPLGINLKKVLPQPALALFAVDLLVSTGSPILDSLMSVIAQRPLLVYAAAKEIPFILQFSHTEPCKGIF